MALEWPAQRSGGLQGAQGPGVWTSLAAFLFFVQARRRQGRAATASLGKKGRGHQPASFCSSRTHQIVTYPRWGECLRLEPLELFGCTVEDISFNPPSLTPQTICISAMNDTSLFPLELCEGSFSFFILTEDLNENTHCWSHLLMLHI